MLQAPMRGNGPRRGGWNRNLRNDSRFAKITPKPPLPLGAFLDNISIADLKISTNKFEDVAVITNAKTVASFNWIAASNPTIAIPGQPPLWTPSHGPSKLQEDKGDFPRDRNAAQYPKHPMEPAIVAGIKTVPNLGQDIDIVACGSTLGNLLRFVRGEDKSFRILVELIGETLFLIRRENSPGELIEDVRGFGHTFPEAYTTWDLDLKNSTSHQRIIRYNFGGLLLLVRFEADGYLQPSSSARPKNTTTNSKSNNIDDLTKSFAGVGMPATNDTNTALVGEEQLTVKSVGESIDQGSIFDLKTRGIWKMDQDLLGSELPRLWVANISNFIAAYHEKGLFKPENIKVKNVKPEIASWEKDHNSELANLASVLHILVAKAKERSDGKFEICRSDVGGLELRSQLGDAGDALSEKVKKAWIESSRSDSGVKKGDVINDEGVVLSWDEGVNDDYTACTRACGYCGQCSY